MAAGLFVNFSESEVLAILSKAKAMLMEGKTIMSYADQGTSVSKQFPMPVREVIEECNYALRVLNPDEYGLARSTRRVHSNYAGRNPL